MTSIIGVHVSLLDLALIKREKNTMKKLILIFFVFELLPEGLAQTANYGATQVVKLENALHKYEQMTGWVTLPLHFNFKEGDRHPLIIQLKNNLALLGDYHSSNDAQPYTEVFDTQLTEALKKFQQRHGQTVDGIFGNHTASELNISPASRVMILKQAIEQWHKIADSSFETFLLVNILDFSMEIIDSGTVLQSMKIVSGDIEHPTPEFESEITGFIIHPRWIVPSDIFIDEILPHLQTNHKYLTQQNMLLYTYNNGKKMLVDPDTVYWKRITQQHLPYQVEQLPGPWNPLGDIKFTLHPSCRFCLHDTPQKNLFQYRERAFSHGCIRIENAQEVAAWLIGKSNDEMEELIEDSPYDTFFRLPVPVCVHVGYFTSWVAEDGSLQFRKDVYQEKKHRHVQIVSGD